MSEYGCNVCNEQYSARDPLKCPRVLTGKNGGKFENLIFFLIVLCKLSSNVVYPVFADLTPHLTKFHGEIRIFIFSGWILLNFSNSRLRSHNLPRLRHLDFRNQIINFLSF